MRACVRRYLLLRLHPEPALLRRDGRDRAVGRRWLRRVRPTLIGTGGALHSHTKPGVRAAACVCVCMWEWSCLCLRAGAHIYACTCACERARVCVALRACASARVSV